MSVGAISQAAKAFAANGPLDANSATQLVQLAEEDGKVTTGERRALRDVSYDYRLVRDLAVAVILRKHEPIPTPPVPLTGAKRTVATIGAITGMAVLGLTASMPVMVVGAVIGGLAISLGASTTVAGAIGGGFYAVVTLTFGGLHVADYVRRGVPILPR